MRRFISTILALLVLLLSCMPCDEAKAATELQQTTVTVQENNHHESHQDIDSCSPFCTCACCSGFILPVISILSSIEELPYFQKPLAAHPQSSLLEVFIPVWQPPQLV